LPCLHLTSPFARFSCLGQPFEDGGICVLQVLDFDFEILYPNGVKVTFDVFPADADQQVILTGDGYQCLDAETAGNHTPGCAIEFLPPGEPFQELIASDPDSKIEAKFKGTVIVGGGCYCDDTCGTYDDGSVRGRDLQAGSISVSKVESEAIAYKVAAEPTDGNDDGCTGFFLFCIISHIIVAFLSLFGF